LGDRLNLEVIKESRFTQPVDEHPLSVDVENLLDREFLPFGGGLAVTELEVLAGANVYAFLGLALYPAGDPVFCALSTRSSPGRRR